MMVQIMVMVFRRRRQTYVQRIKHVVDTSGGLTSTAAIVPLATGVNVRTDPFNPSECLTGETVNGIYISFFIIGSTGAPLTGPIDWYIAKLRNGQSTTVDFPVPGNTGPSLVRNQIFHEEKGLSGSGDGTPMVFKGVIAVPSGMRRMREGDQIFIKAKSNGADENSFCIKAIYKSLS